jgi:diguanylate cyclase (GGDEF)-like protein
MDQETVKKIISIQEETVLDQSIIEGFAYDENAFDAYVEKTVDPYSQIIFTLTHKKIAEAKARLLWIKIIAHLQLLEQQLSRKVGLNVATLDYLENIVLKNTAYKIIDEASLESIVDFSTIDELTQLYNRDIFDVFIKKLLDESKRSKSVLSYAMFDIDDFKKVNDTYGHQIGDQVLKTIGDIIKKNIREMDIGVRYGGEELGVIFPKIDKKRAVSIAERIRKNIEVLFKKDWNVTISCGIADSHDKKDVDSLINAADEALYKAKNSGKNQVCSQ